MRYWIETGQQKAGAPLAPDQVRALDALDALLGDPALVVEFDLHEGDVFLVNNHLVAHGRTEYEDADVSSRRRHLVRLWQRFRTGPAAARPQARAEGTA
jgi:alpha-ketoglutarate-dependent taurine dioxygenase